MRELKRGPTVWLLSVPYVRDGKPVPDAERKTMMAKGRDARSRYRAEHRSKAAAEKARDAIKKETGVEFEVCEGFDLYL